MKSSFTVLLGIVLFTTLAFVGCINYEQEVRLKSDGSGSMTIHYWAKESNVMWLSNSKLAFDEAKIREQYKSDNITVTSVKVDLDTKDSTKHVRVGLDFVNINRLTEVPGFKDMTIKWEDKGETQVLRHELKKDTSAAGGFGMNEYTITYTYVMPADVLASNATQPDGRKLTWKYNLSQLGSDLIMTATVQKASAGGGSTVIIILIVIAVLVIGAILLIMRRRS